MIYNATKRLELVREFAGKLGFCAAGVTTAQPLDDEYVRRYHEWLDSGRAGEMSYMARDAEKRFHPHEIFPAAKSVIVLAMSFAPREFPQTNPDEGYVCVYARGRDYHKVLRKRAEKLTAMMRDEFGDFESKICVDTAPVAERSLAVRAGLGFIGKNSLLIVPGFGSMLVLCEIFCSLEIQPTPAGEVPSCGTCEKCVAACPTAALGGDGELDSARCISYQTIENGGEIPVEIAGRIGNRIFGCDECMLACPYNAGLAPGDGELRNDEFVAPKLADVLNWDDALWDSFTRGHAMRRAKLAQFHRNAEIAVKDI